MKLKLNLYINKLIRSKKMKQYEVAERSGLNLYHLRNFIAPGGKSTPYLGSLIKIIMAINCTDEETRIILNMAKKMRPNEPYELFMPQKDRIKTTRLKAKYQRYYEMLTENLEAESSIRKEMINFLDYLKFKRYG